jgi:hypothetical protein
LFHVLSDKTEKIFNSIIFLLSFLKNNEIIFENVKSFLDSTYQTILTTKNCVILRKFLAPLLMIELDKNIKGKKYEFKQSY